MIYFYSPCEGGKFRKHITSPKRPRAVVREYRGDDSCVLLFRCGMTHDANLKRLGYKHWRHKYNITGGRRDGKKKYKYLNDVLSVATEDIYEDSK